MNTSAQLSKRTDSMGYEKPIRFRSSLRNTVYDVMLDRGWHETISETEWDFFWVDVHYLHENYDTMNLRNDQRINHFKNHYELTRKDLLVKNMNRIKKETAKKSMPESDESIGSHYTCISKSYVLPQEYNMFIEAYKQNAEIVWIMKPVGKAQGKGIFLIRKLSQINQWKIKMPRSPTLQLDADLGPEPYLVQQYIDKPYLIGGKKFDIRAYALVTCWNPLTIYIHRHAFCRFSSTSYSMDDISNMHIHATNVSIQKTSPNYNKSKGSKWMLSNLKQYMTTVHGDTEVRDLFNAIEETMIRPLVAVHKLMITDKHCFELYGFDVLIAADLRPWLLEINASPSLSAETQWDYDLKYNLLNDMFDVVDLEGRRSSTSDLPLRVGGFDLVYWDKPVPHTNASIYESYLGAYHPIQPTKGRFNARRRKSTVIPVSSDEQGNI